MEPTAARLLVCFTACLMAPRALPAADLGRELLEAAAQGRTAGVQDLVAKGAPLETRDKNGRTPLMLAAQHGHAAIVQLLLDRGADAGARDPAGATAWTLATFAPAGNRAGSDAVLELLPRPARPKVAVEAAWTAGNLYNSCIMRLDQLTRLVSSLAPDRMALAAFQQFASASGKGLIERCDSADCDAVVTLAVRPGAACVPQQSADRLSFTVDVRLLRARDRAELLHRNMGGGALKSWRATVVTGEAQYLPVYQESLKPYIEQAYWACVEAWFQAK
jgi:hypothetical protein